MRFLLFLFILSQSCLVSAASTIVWMRPVSDNINVEGYKIVSGSEYELMRYLAGYLSDWNHEYESYPVKRSWEFIKNSSTDARLYCFFGASQTPERESWAVFSKATSILLPYPIVAKEGSLDEFVTDGFVSLHQLLQKGKTTALFDGVVNSFSRLVDNSYQKSNLLLRLNPGQEASSSLTTRLIKANRIDFGFVGSGDRELRELEKKFDIRFSLYQLLELAGDIHKGNRIMCSQSPSGLRAVRHINRTMQLILSEEASSKAFRDLNFNVIGYLPNLKSTFDKHWGLMEKPEH